MAIALIAVGTGIISCKSSSEKVEDAKEGVKDANKNLNSVIKDSLTEVQKTANVAEWKIFRNESQVKIKNNEIRINALKSSIKAKKFNDNSEARESIDSLEIRNKELVARMDNYNRGKSDWETFKLEFNRDLDGLGESLRKFTVKNKGK